LPGQAATFSTKRGLNLDQWVIWPGEDRWGDAKAILPYPEWRKFLKEGDSRRSGRQASISSACPSTPRLSCPNQTVALRYGGASGIVDAFNGDKAEPDVMDVIRSLH